MRLPAMLREQGPGERPLGVDEFAAVRLEPFGGGVGGAKLLSLTGQAVDQGLELLDRTEL